MSSAVELLAARACAGRKHKQQLQFIILLDVAGTVNYAIVSKLRVGETELDSFLFERDSEERFVEIKKRGKIGIYTKYDLLLLRRKRKKVIFLIFYFQASKKNEAFLNSGSLLVY